MVHFKAWEGITQYVIAYSFTKTRIGLGKEHVCIAHGVLGIPVNFDHCNMKWLNLDKPPILL